jgi:hypothetical protein
MRTRRSSETMDHFVEHNQIQSVEESIGVASWKRPNCLKLILEQVATIVRV